MTHKAHKVVSRNRKIYRKYKDTTHPAVIEASNATRREVKKAKKQFELKLVNNIKEDRKSFFAYVGSKSKSNVNVSSLVDSQGELTSDSKAKAEMLNDFFSSVFTKELQTDMPNLDNLYDAKLVDISVTVDSIKNKLQKLKEDKAACADNMSPRILKALCEEIAVPVTIIFRKSLDTGCVHGDWRTANVSPLFNKGSRHKVDNYRPVNLTSQICKVV